jgi:hypothetical protein
MASGSGIKDDGDMGVDRESRTEESCVGRCGRVDSGDKPLADVTVDALTDEAMTIASRDEVVREMVGLEAHSN